MNKVIPATKTPADRLNSTFPPLTTSTRQAYSSPLASGCPDTVAIRHYCTEHAREADKARGTSTQRGYGAAHINARKALAPTVATGTVKCVRCGQVIKPGMSWHLDHTDDRTGYLGAACATCNMSAGGKKAHPPTY